MCRNCQGNTTDLSCYLLHKISTEKIGAAFVRTGLLQCPPRLAALYASIASCNLRRDVQEEGGWMPPLHKVYSKGLKLSVAVHSSSAIILGTGSLDLA